MLPTSSNNFIDTPFLVDGPDSNRTNPLNIDFSCKENIVLDSRFDCKVVLRDIYSENPTAKLNLLKVNQENTHSVLSQRSSENLLLNSLLKKKDILWPSLTNVDAWSEFDNSVEILLAEVSPLATLQEKVENLESIVYKKASELFGFVPPPKKGLRGKNRRVRLSINLVMEKNRLLKEFENEEDLVLKSSLFNLLEVVRKRLRSLRKGEAKRKQRWKNKQAHKLFLKNPYIAGKNVLDPQCTAKLIVDKDSLDNHKSSTLIDPLCNVPLPSLEGLPPPPSISSPFVTQKLTFSEFKKIVNSRRNGSAPGINKIPYKVYKKCPNICSYLFRLFKSCIKNCVVPLQWRMASEVYIPKNKNPDSTNINDFRPISLLNVEGKLFFSLVSKRIENHIFRNNIIDKSVQKGCMERVPGCWEHMSVVGSMCQCWEHMSVPGCW